MQSDVGTVLMRKWCKDMHTWYCDNVFVTYSVDGSDNAFELSVPGKSDRYMTVRSNGGLNQMHTGVSRVHQNLALGSSLSILISTCFHIYKYIFVLVQIIASFLFSRVF
jgi:hypothetical protein